MDSFLSISSNKVLGIGVMRYWVELVLSGIASFAVATAAGEELVKEHDYYESSQSVKSNLNL